MAEKKEKKAFAKKTSKTVDIKRDCFVVVRINGRQYIVSEGDEILIDKLDPKEIKPEVLLSVEGDEVNVGKPILEKSSVSLKVLKEEEKGKKLYVFKYKSKSRYRKKTGFRPKYTRLLVEKISK